MKSSLLLLSFIISVAGYGQGKLKTDVTANGDTLYSTGDKKIYTAPGARNSIGEILKSNVYKSRSGFSLNLYIQTGRTSVFTISPEDAVQIAFNDGTSLTLYPNGDNSSHRSALDYGCYMFVFYHLDREAIGQLRLQNIEKITVATSQGKMVYELKDKQSDAIRKQVMSFE